MKIHAYQIIIMSERFYMAVVTDGAFYTISENLSETGASENVDI